MNYWLMKTEPETFGIDDLKRKGREHWDGVRNFQARANMVEMKVGDLALIHHTGKTPGVAGVAKIVKEAYPDFTSWDKKSDYYDPKSTEGKTPWRMVDVEFVKKFAREVPLAEIKAEPKLKHMVLVKAPRLSVQPVTKDQFDFVVKLSKS